MKKYFDEKDTNLNLVQEICEKVPKNLPFSNGGCIDKLNEHYRSLQEFLININLENPYQLGFEATKLLNKTLNIFNNECMAPIKSLTENSGQCLTYLQKSLVDANIGFNNDLLDGSQSNMMNVFLPLKLDYLKKFMFKILSDDFWMNAPTDCGLYKLDKATEEEKNFDSDVDTDDNDDNEAINDNLESFSWNGEIGTQDTQPNF